MRMAFWFANLEIAIALKEALKDKETDEAKEVDKKENG